MVKDHLDSERGNPLPPSIIRGRKEGNVLFNDTLNTFYLWLYGNRHVVEDHLDSERGNPLPPLHELIVSISSKGFLYAPFHSQDRTYHILCYSNRGALAGKRNSSMGPPRGTDLTTHRTTSGRSITELHHGKRVLQHSGNNLFSVASQFATKHFRDCYTLWGSGM